MRKEIFEKASKLKPELLFEQEDRAYFKVKQYEIRLWYYDRALKFNCTCMWGSVGLPIHLTPCSHILSVFKYLMEGKKDKIMLKA